MTKRFQRAILITFSISISIPTASSAHKVPWTAKHRAFDDFRQAGKPELAEHLARYCYLLRKKPEQCVFVLLKNLKESSAVALKKKAITKLVAYANCAKKFELFAIGRGKNCDVDDAGCTWHETYVNDLNRRGRKGFGLHRHQYTEGQMDIIAENLGDETIRRIIRQCKSTKECGGLLAHGNSWSPKVNRQRKVFRKYLLQHVKTNPNYYAPAKLSTESFIPRILCQKCKAYCFGGGGQYQRIMNKDYDGPAPEANDGQPLVQDDSRCSEPKMNQRATIKVFKRETERCVKQSLKD